MYYSFYANTPLGDISLSSDGDALCGLWFKGQKYYPENIEEYTADNKLSIFEETLEWLNIYFTGAVPNFVPKLSPKGSAFRQEVWKLLMEIPYGETVSYGQLAAQISAIQGKARMSAQAVGSAVGHNPISLIIPCHRVVGSSGNLTGYAGGIDRKLALLKLEGVDTATFFIPRHSTAP